ncbi:hypothetical protein I6N90_08870 [Paenibacillus sp. GSMTC-2017]|uniref:hypothetical protein n=1 Tax=Paenibacillus sp. GSMTC-2017 TaxID=2794350 RepID=UPI0018D5D250|nr:hypothetical protein [Paenibacillus sp. GSMTC-2017]MBH5317914.1 hypothetical protein [Paenibacillus sp. GSMTC-2017]
MKKPRLFPIVITAVLSIGLLFGGWTLYKQVAVASPLTDALKAVPGVVEAKKPTITQDNVQIAVELSENANIRDIYEAATKTGKDITPSKKIDLQVRTSEDEVLNTIWQQSMFEVAEAMETKTYSKIPEALKLATESVKGVSFETEMDDSNVYVTLRNDKSAKYIVMPRTPNKLGAWSNA